MEFTNTGALFQTFDFASFQIRAGIACRDCIQTTDHATGNFGNPVLQFRRLVEDVARMQFCESAGSQESGWTSLSIWNDARISGSLWNERSFRNATTGRIRRIDR